MKLDEYLESQSSGVQCILEKIPDDESVVRLTPYVGDACGCGTFAITVNKGDITDLEPTGELYRGKKVVEVSFKEGATIKIMDVLSAMMVKKGVSDEASHHAVAPIAFSPPPHYGPSGIGGYSASAQPLMYNRCCCLFQSGRGYDTLAWNGYEWYVAVAGRCDGSVECNRGQHGRHYCY